MRRLSTRTARASSVSANAPAAATAVAVADAPPAPPPRPNMNLSLLGISKETAFQDLANMLERIRKNLKEALNSEKYKQLSKTQREHIISQSASAMRKRFGHSAVKKLLTEDEIKMLNAHNLEVHAELRGMAGGRRSTRKSRRSSRRKGTRKN